MNKRLIKTNAGIIWNLLNNYQRWNVSMLSKTSGLSEKDVLTAIGWLVCENKVEIEQIDGEERFYLMVEYYF